MGVETPVTFGGLLLASIFLIVVNFAPRIYDWLKLRAEIKERETQAKREAEARAMQAEAEKDDKVWDRVVQEYERQIERNGKLEQENEQLRPLALANAILEQNIRLCREDKEDWKSHATSLEEQLMQNNIIPRPFKRLPREGDTQERLKTVSQKMKAIRETHAEENGKPASEGSPTLIFPPVAGSGPGKEEQ